MHWKIIGQMYENRMWSCEKPVILVGNLRITSCAGIQRLKRFSVILRMHNSNNVRSYTRPQRCLWTDFMLSNPKQLTCLFLQTDQW